MNTNTQRKYSKGDAIVVDKQYIYRQKALLHNAGQSRVILMKILQKVILFS